MKSPKNWKKKNFKI